MGTRVSLESLFSVQERSIVVTGGAGGIGSEICRALGDLGARVVVADLATDRAVTVAAEVTRAGGVAIPYGVDVTRPEAVDAMIDCVLAEFGVIDVWFNNAGIALRGPVLDQPLEEWRRTLEVNLTGMFICLQLCGRHMIARRSGKIINMASVSAVIGRVGRAAYAASKAGVIQLTRVLANEWASYGIMVNAIAPGITDTPMNEDIVSTEIYQQRIQRIPLGRAAVPRDLVGAVVFLASSASDYITGQTVFVEGGRLIE